MPLVTSPTHGSQAAWTADRGPSFAWSAGDATSGVAGFSFALDQIADTTPTTASSGTATSAQFAGLVDGSWYFHVRAVDVAGNWGPARTPPRARRRDRADHPRRRIADSSHARHGLLQRRSGVHLELDRRGVGGRRILLRPRPQRLDAARHAQRGSRDEPFVRRPGDGRLVLPRARRRRGGHLEHDAPLPHRGGRRDADHRRRDRVVGNDHDGRLRHDGLERIDHGPHDVHAERRPRLCAAVALPGGRLPRDGPLLVRRLVARAALRRPPARRL